jgi:hypothetical protein
MRTSVFVAALAGTLALAGTAIGQGVSPDQLSRAGWTCFLDPANPRIVCSDPGHGRPVSPPPPDRPPSYDFMIFDLSGGFEGTIHLIRTDLYHGQPCPQTGGDYTLIPPIGYYRCEHL